MQKVIRIEHLRESFKEIIELLNQLKIHYWAARGLTEQIQEGVINDEEAKHDIDFHIFATDRNTLLEALKRKRYKKIDSREYKIQINAKTDNRRYEFVFLKEDNGFYCHKRKNRIFRHPMNLFGDEKVIIQDIECRIPAPLDEYVSIIQD